MKLSNKFFLIRKECIQQQGKSMIEMLGVLAIIGILGIVALNGFQKALFRYKLNKQTSQISQIFASMNRYKNEWKFSTWVSLLPYFEALGEIPNGMEIYGNLYVYDVFNNTIVLSNNGGPDFKLIHTVIDMPVNRSDEMCINLLHIVKAFHLEIYNMFMGYSDGSNHLVNMYYGTKYCQINGKCINQLNISKMKNFCDKCQKSLSCNLDVQWLVE